MGSCQTLPSRLSERDGANGKSNSECATSGSTARSTAWSTARCWTGRADVNVQWAVEVSGFPAVGGRKSRCTTANGSAIPSPLVSRRCSPGICAGPRPGGWRAGDMGWLIALSPRELPARPALHSPPACPALTASTLQAHCTHTASSHCTARTHALRDTWRTSTTGRTTPDQAPARQARHGRTPRARANCDSTVLAPHRDPARTAPHR